MDVDVDVDDPSDTASTHSAEHRDDPHQQTFAVVKGVIVRNAQNATSVQDGFALRRRTSCNLMKPLPIRVVGLTHSLGNVERNRKRCPSELVREHTESARQCVENPHRICKKFDAIGFADGR